MKETIKNEQMIRFVQFRDQIELFIERDMAKAAKHGDDKRPLIVTEKPPVFTSAITYEYVKKTVDALSGVQPMTVQP